jgi:hypothetical protein
MLSSIFASMRISVTIVLFLFITFISLPTIIGVLNSDTDISMVYSMSEEEESHKTISIKEAIKLKKEVFLISYQLTFTKKIISENHIQYDDVLEEIFSPPPEV